MVVAAAVKPIDFINSRLFIFKNKAHKNAKNSRVNDNFFEKNLKIKRIPSPQLY